MHMRGILRRNIGCLEAGRGYDPWRSSVLELAGSLEDGQVSDVVANEQGIFLVRLIERQSGYYRNFEAVEKTIKESLRMKKKINLYLV